MTDVNDFKRWQQMFDKDDSTLVDELMKDALQEDFKVFIPDNFADQVTELVEKRKSIREALLQHLVLYCGLLSIVGFAFALLYYVDSENLSAILNFIVLFKYPISFGLLCLLGIQLADSFLLSRTKDLLEK